MITIKAGHTNKGIICKDCIKYQKKYGTFCSRISHHKNRTITRIQKKKNSIQIKNSILDKLNENSRDYNYAELVTAVCLLVPGIKNKQDIIDNCKLVECHDISGYLLNLERRTPKVVSEYIEYVNNLRPHFPNISRIIILGKSHFKYSDVMNLNRDLEIKKCKSDLMLEDIYHRWIGISVKSSDKCYLSNYSLEKILPNGEELHRCKTRYLMDEGFPEFKKEERKEVNELFQIVPGRENPYWNLVNETIEKYETQLTNYLIELLSSSYTCYPVYEFDGKSMIDLNRYLGPYLKSQNLKLIRDHSIRKGAKLVYHLQNLEKQYYKVEIRWKGNVYQSPQIMMQKM